MIEREIEIYLQTPLVSATEKSPFQYTNNAHIAGSAIKGALRQCFRQTIGDKAHLESEIFGDTTSRGCMLISDAKLINDSKTESRPFVELNSRTGSAKTSKLFIADTIKDGAVFRVRILLDDISSREALRAADSTIQWLHYLDNFPIRFGKKRSLGYGQARFQLLNFSQVGKVFISYTHEDTNHVSWVLALANRLDRLGFDVILDVYDLAPGSNVHIFMERAIEDASKVLMILTPTYKNKASYRQGGVGYEFSMIISELSEQLANNSKYIPALRKGSAQDSVPIMLKPYLYCDVRDEDFEKCATIISDAVLEKTQKTRPRDRNL